MSKRSPALLVMDMLEAVKKACRYTLDYDFERFQSDERTSDAVVRNLEIIGEAASRLPVEFREQYQDIEWNKIIGLRHRIVHEYFGVDLELIWYILKKDLPVLRGRLEKLSGDLV